MTSEVTLVFGVWVSHIICGATSSCFLENEKWIQLEALISYHLRKNKIQANQFSTTKTDEIMRKKCISVNSFS